MARCVAYLKTGNTILRRRLGRVIELSVGTATFDFTDFSRLFETHDAIASTGLLRSGHFRRIWDRDSICAFDGPPVFDECDQCLTVDGFSSKVIAA